MMVVDMKKRVKNVGRCQKSIKVRLLIVQRGSFQGRPPQVSPPRSEAKTCVASVPLGSNQKLFRVERLNMVGNDQYGCLVVYTGYL